MSDDFIPMDEDHIENPDIEMLKNCLNSHGKGNESNKNDKKEAPKRPPKVLLPPCIVYVSNAAHTVLKVPFSLQVRKSSAKKTSDVKFCKCGAKAKYREPKTLTPFCSVQCYKKLKA